MSVCLCLPTVHPSLSVHPSLPPSVCPSIRPSIRPSVCLSLRPSSVRPSVRPSTRLSLNTPLFSCHDTSFALRSVQYSDLCFLLGVVGLRMQTRRSQPPYRCTTPSWRRGRCGAITWRPSSPARGHYTPDCHPQYRGVIFLRRSLRNGCIFK